MRTGRILTGAEYRFLADEYENLVATKNSTTDADRLQSLFSEAPQLRHFITEAGFAKACHMGECGFLVSFLSTNFARAKAYFQAGCECDAAHLAANTAIFDGLIAAFKDAVGSSVHMDGAFDKMFCRVHDPEFPLRLLPPYDSVSEEQFDQYLRRLKQHPSYWLP